MAVGFAAAEANATLDARAVDWDFVQLHTGDPGSAGTANVAGNSTRKAITWASAAGGSIANDANIDWSDAEVTTAEDYTHVSLWTLATGGTFKASGTVTANAVAASGDAFRLATGAVVVTLNVAA